MEHCNNCGSIKTCEMVMTPLHIRNHANEVRDIIWDFMDKKILSWEDIQESVDRLEYITALLDIWYPHYCDISDEKLRELKSLTPNAMAKRIRRSATLHRFVAKCETTTYSDGERIRLWRFYCDEESAFYFPYDIDDITALTLLENYT